MAPVPDLTFVIPVRDDEDRLAACLRSIASNEYPGDRIEIVVVDNVSRDGSPAIAASAGARVIRSDASTVSALRNTGAGIASGRILAFVDADHAIGTGWIRVAVDACDADHTVGGIGSLCRAPEGGTWVQQAYDRLRGRRTGRRTTEWLGAGNLAIVRTAFEQVGGFDTSIVTCEDVDLCKRLRAHGYRLIDDDRMVNTHFGDPSTVGALFRGELWRGRGNLAVSFRPPVTLRELPSAVIPIVELGSIAAIVALSVIPGQIGILVAAAALPLIAIPAARALRTSWRSRDFGPRHFVENLAVAFVYDCARALALVTFAGHSIRRRKA